MSTGDEMKTLGDYVDLCEVLFGADSASVKFFVEKIKAQGRDAKVLADETQMMMVIMSMEQGDRK